MRICRTVAALVDQHFRPAVLHLDVLWPLWFLHPADRIPPTINTAFLQSFLQQPGRGALVRVVRIRRWDDAAHKTYDAVVRELLTTPDVLPNLEEVVIERTDRAFLVSAAFLSSIGKAHPKLRKLCLYNCWGSRPFTVREAADIGAATQNLESFRIQGQSCGYLGDRHLDRLVTHWSKLQELEIAIDRQPSNITDDGLRSIARSTHNLRVLELRLTHMTSTGLEDILISNPHLRVLNISQCPNLGRQTIPSLVQYAPSLHVLHVHCCPWMDDTALQRLVHSGCLLRTLGMDNTRVTPAGLRQVLSTQQPRHLGKAPRGRLEAAIDVGYFATNTNTTRALSKGGGGGGNRQSLFMSSILFPEQSTKEEVETSDRDEWLALADEFDVNFAVNRFAR